MTYYPKEKWIDMLFSMGDYNLFREGKLEPLDEKDSYIKILELAKENLGDRPITQVSLGPDYDEYILELTKQHGIFLLTDPKYKEDQDLGDHLLLVPMFVDHNSQEPQDVWLIDLDNKTYDGIPFSDNYNGSIYNFYQLDKRFISKVEKWLQEYYGEEIGYDAINKRRVL